MKKPIKATETAKKPKTPKPAKTAKTAIGPGKKADPEKLHKEIHKRAHEIFLARGDGEGDALSDWLQAEREIRKKHKLN